MRSIAMMFNRDAGVASPQSFAIAASSATTAVVATQTFNDQAPNNIVQLTFTADNAGGTAAVNDVYLFKGAGDISRSTLPGGVTLSGDYASLANLHDFFSRVPVKVLAMTVQTSDVANFAKRMEVAMDTPSQQNADVMRINLVDYRQTVGNTFADTLKIANKPFIVLPQTRFKFQILKNSSITLTLEVPQVAISAALSDIGF